MLRRGFKLTDRMLVRSLVLGGLLGLLLAFGPKVYCVLWGADDLRCMGSLR